MEWMARWDDVGGGRWVVGGVKLLVLLVLLVLWLFVLLLVLWEGGIIDVAGNKNQRYFWCILYNRFVYAFEEKYPGTV